MLWPRPPTYSARWTSQPPSWESLVQAAVTTYLVFISAKAVVDMWNLTLNPLTTLGYLFNLVGVCIGARTISSCFVVTNWMPEVNWNFRGFKIMLENSNSCLSWAGCPGHFPSPTLWITSCSSDWPNSPNWLRDVNEPTAQVVNHLFRPQHHAARSAVRLNKIWRDVTAEPHTSSKWTRLSLGEIARLPRSAERGKDLRNADFFQWWKILE